MKFLVYFLGLIVLLMAIIFGFGAILPSKTYIEKTVVVRASSDAVWKTLNDYKNWGSWWQTYATSNIDLKIEKDIPLIWITTKSGANPIAYMITDLEKNKKLTLATYPTSSNQIVDVSWTFELTTLTNATQIKVIYVQSIHSAMARLITFFIKDENPVDKFINSISKKYGN